MKTLVALISTLMAFKAFSCDSVLINIIGEKSLVERKVTKELIETLGQQYEGIKVFESSLYIFPNIQNEEKVAPNTVIIGINSETDMTGPDIKVLLYKSDSQGSIEFQGGHREMTNRYTKDKFKTLYRLALTAVNLSCGNY